MQSRHLIGLRIIFFVTTLAFLSTSVSVEYKLWHAGKIIKIKEISALFDFDNLAPSDNNSLSLFDVEVLSLFDDEVLSLFNADNSKTRAHFQHRYAGFDYSSRNIKSHSTLALPRDQFNQDKRLLNWPVLYRLLNWPVLYRLGFETLDVFLRIVSYILMTGICLLGFLIIVVLTYVRLLYCIRKFSASLENFIQARFIQNKSTYYAVNDSAVRILKIYLKQSKTSLRVNIEISKTRGISLYIKSSKCDLTRNENAIFLTKFKKIIDVAKFVLISPLSSYLKCKTTDLTNTWPLNTVFTLTRPVLQQYIVFSVLGRLATFRSLLGTPIHQATSFISLSNAGFYYNEASGSLVCEGCGSTVDVLALSSSSRIINRYHADGCTFVNNGEEPEISGTNCEINISTDRDPKGEIEGSFSMVSNHSEEKDYELPENDQKPNSFSCTGSEKVKAFDEEKDFKDLTQMQGQRSSHELKFRLLQKENKSLRAQLKCRICKVTPVTNMFLPCGELYACDVCSKELTRCPGCNQKILATATVYLV